LLRQAEEGELPLKAAIAPIPPSLHEMNAGIIREPLHAGCHLKNRLEKNLLLSIKQAKMSQNVLF
jgi:hypothetical protein